MTRRIATAILVTVWATLLLAGTGAYFVTRSVLLRDLDESQMQRAVSLPELSDGQGHQFVAVPAMPEDDRYLVQDEAGRNVARLNSADPRARAKYLPKLLRASFSRQPDGTLFRTVTLEAFGRPIDKRDDAAAAVVPVTVTYRGSAEQFDHTMSLLMWTLIGGGAISGVIAAFAARTVARAALRPIRRTAEIIGSIDERALDQRIDPHQLPPELQAVAERCNEMLARLEDAFYRQRRFLADASHELRTPVAAMLTTLEVALRRPRTDAEYLQAMRASLSDARIMKSLVESMMSQARSELDAPDESSQPVDVADMIEQIVTSVSALADQHGVALEQQSSDSVVLNIQPSRLRSVLVNLIGNAIEHNRAGGRVEIVSRRENGMAQIIVRDDGPGIAPEHAGHVFEPFYRADRTRESNGHLGLGLFLARSHVLKMNGTITLASQLGEGTTFTIAIPCEIERKTASIASRVATLTPV